MTVLEKRAASGFESKRFGSFAWVGALGLVVGIAAAWAFGQVMDEPATSSSGEIRAATPGEVLASVEKSVAAIAAVRGLADDGLSEQLRALVRSYATYAALRSGLDSVSSLEESVAAIAAVRGLADDGLSEQLRALVRSYATYAALRSGLDSVSSLEKSAAAIAAVRGIADDSPGSLEQSAAALAVVRGAE